MSRKSLGFADLFLYAASMALSIRWISTAAATGPASLPGWLFAVVVFSGPLIVATAELTTRFPQEGGVYAWTQHAFGPFWGFLCGWLYWTCNLPFFSGMLYFMVNLFAVAIGPLGRPLLDNPFLFMTAALALSIAAGGLHLLGLGAGKWLSNLGGASSLILFAILIGVGGLIAVQKGPATHFETASYWPPLNANTAILWATMVFAVGGSEALAFLRNDVRGGMKTIHGVLATVGGLQVIVYVLGTAGMLSILTPQEATRLSGLADALTLGLQRIGLGAFAPMALMIAFLGTLGAYSAWFGVAARIPFAAGLDSFLPPVFGRRDPKSGAPVVAIAVQMAIVVVIVVLSQAGDTLKGAYDFLVAMSVLSYTLPFLFLFAVFIAVQHTQMGEAGWRAPGGKRGALIIGWVGLIGTISAVACTLVPSPDAANQIGEILKLVFASVVLVFSGCAAYALASRRASRIAAAERTPT